MAKQRKTKKRKRKRKQTCLWPDCNNLAESIGLCESCKTKHYKSKMLHADSSAFSKEEMIDLYKDIADYMIEQDITREEAVTWLIAEGLNYYELKKKENEK